MQFEFKWKRVLALFSGLTLLWIIFILSTFVLVKEENENHYYVPENSTLTLRFEGKTFFRSAVSSLLFEARDKEVLKQLETLMERRGSKDETTVGAGINVLSDIIVFSQPAANGAIYGILFNLNDPALFRKNMSQQLSHTQAVAENNEVGLLLTFVPRKGNISVSTPDLHGMAQKILAQKNAAPLNIAQADQHRTTFLEMQANGFSLGSEKLFSRQTLRAQVSERELHMQGDFKPVSSLKHTSSRSLKPKGLHITNTLFTKELQDSLSGLLSSQGLNFPPIAKISMNYYGIRIQEAGDKTIMTPEMDLLLEFESDFSLDMFFAQPEGLAKLGLMRTGNGLAAGELKFTVDSLDKRTLFIGLNPQLITSGKNTDLFIVQGDLSRLTQISGGGFIVSALLDAFAPYKAGKAFFESVEQTDIHLKPESGKLKLIGNITFKEGKHALNECMRLFLTLQEQ